MFDPFLHQAAGLRTVNGAEAIRVIPVVLTDRAEPGFELAWMLAAGLSVQGNAVVVLDFSSEESPTRMGLINVIQGAAVASCVDEGAQWAVLPAHLGLGAMLREAGLSVGSAAVEQLGALFEPGTIVVALASADSLDALLDGGRGCPLLSVVSDPTAILQSYGALKALRRSGTLNPVLVPMRGNLNDLLETQIVRVLLDTANRHLFWSPEVWSLPLTIDQEAPVELGNWLLRILESAVVLDATVRDQPFTDLVRSTARGTLVPQLWSC